MNTRHIIDFKKSVTNNTDQVKELEKLRTLKNKKINEINKEISYINDEIAAIDVRNKAHTLFWSPASCKLNVAFRFCTNYSEVSNDPHVRGDDYSYESRNTVIVAGKVSFNFRLKEKRFYSKNNISILIQCLGSEYFSHIWLDLDQKIIDFTTNEADRVKIDFSDLFQDRKISEYLEMLKKKFK